MNRLTDAEDSYRPQIIEAIKALVAVIEVNKGFRTGRDSIISDANDKIEKLMQLLKFTELEAILLQTQTN